MEEVRAALPAGRVPRARAADGGFSPRAQGKGFLTVLKVKASLQC